MAEILQKAERAEGLTPYEAAVLLHTEDKEHIEKMYSAARQVKERIYGRRIVIFAPLYISNYCVNGCRYCGYSCRQPLARRRLTREELIDEVRLLEAMGHKRIALEAGEDPVNCPIEYVLECIETIYATSGGPQGNGHLSDSIRRINVNIAATTVAEYRQLKEAGIGTYILFQETYHRDSYAHWHPVGPKSDYDWHTTAMDPGYAGRNRRCRPWRAFWGSTTTALMSWRCCITLSISNSASVSVPTPYQCLGCARRPGSI